MVATQEDIIRRARALLRLQERPGSEAEAAVAASRLQDLLTRHGLSMATLAGGANAEGAVQEEGPLTGTRMPQWRVQLLAGIGAACGVKVLTLRTIGERSVTQLFGSPAAVAICRETYTYLEAVVDRLCREEMERKQQRYRLHSPRSWGDSWRKGCGARLADRLMEHRRELERRGCPASDTGPECSALAICSLHEEEERAANALIAETHKRVRSGPTPSLGSLSAFIAGAEAANGIALHSRLGGDAPAAAQRALAAAATPEQQP